MGLMFYLAITLLIIGGIVVFTRLPQLAGFVYAAFGLVIFVAYLIQGEILESSVVLFVMIITSLIITLQLFMNVDLEKEFQKVYKRNMTPVITMMFTAFILGAIGLVVYSEEKNQRLVQIVKKTNLAFESSLVFVTGMLVFMGVVMLIGMFRND
ncbi:MAG: hypothetical protein EP319_04365 [Deltaproteobacteria bacterium]|nr:MAG: hypothetical protein EP319_04365 [Deltaproteobacteria bacterium]